jgi:recombination protein RecT
MTTLTEATQRPAKVDGKSIIRDKINQYRPVIGSLLNGTGVSEATFVAQVANALRATPKLWQCDPETVLGAGLKCAQLGLAPNDGRNLAFIIPYGNTAQFQLGYGGVMELARRAAPGLVFTGAAVYHGDEFEFDRGSGVIVHRDAATLGKKREGDAYYWWVRALYPDGTSIVEGLDRAGVEYHRSFSKQPNGEMWSKSYDAGALKSVVLQMRRWLPSSAQMAAALAADETTLDVRDPDREIEAEVISDTEDVTA